MTIMTASWQSLSSTQRAGRLLYALQFEPAATLAETIDLYLTTAIMEGRYTYRQDARGSIHLMHWTQGVRNPTAICGRMAMEPGRMVNHETPVTDGCAACANEAAANYYSANCPNTGRTFMIAGIEGWSYTAVRHHPEIVNPTLDKRVLLTPRNDGTFLARHLYRQGDRAIIQPPTKGHEFWLVNDYATR